VDNGAVQAVPYQRQGRSGAVRWLLHATVVGSILALIVTHVEPASLGSGDFVQSIQGNLALPRSSFDLLDWLPAYNPARTGLPRDPAPPFFAPGFLTRSAPPIPGDSHPPVSWVQTHREAGLYAGPRDDAPRFTTLPAWSYLKVLDSAPGWLLVRYEGDARREAGEAWVPAGTVGPIGRPRWLASIRETPLYAGPELNAPAYTRVPAWTIVESLDKEEGGRVLVNYAGDGDSRLPGQAWAALKDLDVARAPADSELPWGAEPGSGGDVAHLSVPYRTQLDGSAASGANCGPTSVGMALESFGIVASTGQLRQLADRLAGNWDPTSGVRIEVLAAVVERYDARALDLDRPDGSRHRWTLEDVRRQLRAGHPVIPQLRYRLLPGREGFPLGYDHYVVLTGFEGDTFYYNDPIPSGARGRDLAMRSSTLLRAWQSSDEPLAAFAVVR
jgi:hypothetical protein